MNHGRLPTSLEKIAPEQVEEWFLEAAESMPPAVRALTDALEAAPQGALVGPGGRPPQPWAEGVELLLDNLSAESANDAAVCGLLLALARAGIDAPVLRDRLAGAARRRFSRFLDPAAMLKALGLHAADVPAPEIAARWRLLEEIAPGQYCLHPGHGLGRITAIDVLSGGVTVDFGRPRVLPLPAAIADLWIIPQTSPLHPLLENGQTISDAVAAQWTLDALEKAGVPRGRIRPDALQRHLTPAPFSDKQFARFLGKGAVAVAGAATSTRPVAEARNLLECLESLRRVGPDWRPGPAEWAVIRTHLAGEKGRSDRVESFAEAVARVLQAAADAPEAAEIIRGLDDAACWETPERFAAVSIALAGRHVPWWFRATLIAKGPDWFAEAAQELPLRLLRRAWNIAEENGVQECFLEHIRRRLERGSAPPDILVWLWRHSKSSEPLLRNPQMLLHALSEDARGPFIDAQKQLRKLLLDDPEFQAFLLDNGNPDAVASLVRNVLHLPGLDAGERQSLLVKIVRQFPETRKLVEQKKPVHGTPGGEAAKPERLVTSMRSYELRRRELEEIINVKIPANSRAIAHARGYGDLRENAEYKAAKEMQRVLGRQREELERDLNEVVPTDFSTVRVTDRVVPGCIVVLERDGAAPETITLLGLWDSAPESGIISYKTGLGQALLGKRAGEEVDLPAGGHGIIREVRPLPRDLQPWLRGEDLPPSE